MKKCLEMFAAVAEKKDDYKKFYEHSGKCLKLGIHEGFNQSNQNCRVVAVQYFESGDEQTSLKEYVDRMKEGQNDIYYITGCRRVIISNLGTICIRRVWRYFTWWTLLMSAQCNSSRKFDGKKLKATTKEGLDIGEEDEKKKLEELKAEFEPLTKLMMDVLGR